MTFHRAHAVDWCQMMNGTGTGFDLATLKAAVVSRKAAGQDTKGICGMCAEFARRHVRNGVDASDYDTANEPLCTYLNSEATQVIYHTKDGVTDADALATDWCGCSG